MSLHSSMVWAKSTWFMGILISPIWSCLENLWSRSLKLELPVKMTVSKHHTDQSHRLQIQVSWPRSRCMEPWMKMFHWIQDSVFSDGLWFQTFSSCPASGILCNMDHLFHQHHKLVNLLLGSRLQPTVWEESGKKRLTNKMVIIDRGYTHLVQKFWCRHMLDTYKLFTAHFM